MPLTSTLLPKKSTVSHLVRDDAMFEKISKVLLLGLLPIFSEESPRSRFCSGDFKRALSSAATDTRKSSFVLFRELVVESIVLLRGLRGLYIADAPLGALIGCIAKDAPQPAAAALAASRSWPISPATAAVRKSKVSDRDLPYNASSIE